MAERLKSTASSSALMCFRCALEIMAYEIKLERVANDLHLWVGSARFAAEVRDPRSLRGRSRSGDDHGPRKIVAPMPGKVVRLLAREGDEVEARMRRSR